MAVASVVLKVIRETQSKDGPDNGFGMWVIMYYDPESRKHTKNSVKVVCGSFYPMNGERRYAAKGMSPRDFEDLRPHYKQFEAWAKNPPPIPEPEAPQEKVEEPTIDDVPF